MNGGYELLAEAIIERAIVDYRRYKKRDKVKAKSCITFLNSQWCELLLEATGSNLKGNEIVSILKKEDNNEK